MLSLRTPETLQLLQGSQQLFPALIQAFDSAVSWIQLETYIFHFHGTGADVANALVRAAGRGVKVQVLVDAVGSGPLPARWKKTFADAGVEWSAYSPTASSFGLLAPERWRRLHRKLCVIDQSVVFCGGINVLDDFYDPNHGVLQAPRFDFAVAVTGPLALEATDAMALLWWRVKAGYSAREMHLNAAWEKFKAAGYGERTDGTLLAQPPDSGMAPLPGKPRPKAALVLRDNLLNRRSIELAYRKAIGRARREVIIANAYFLPGGKLRRALVKAARRGVRVTLLLQGKYEYFMQYHAARPVYGALLAAGVEIHEYSTSFLHAKVAVVDGHWATVGSSNLDPLSLLLAREANIVVEDRAFTQELSARLREAVASHGQRIDPAAYGRRPLARRIQGWIAYALMRLALMLTRQRY